MAVNVFTSAVSGLRKICVELNAFDIEILPTY